MLKLISFMPNNNSLIDFNVEKSRLDALNIQGIETIIGDYCSPNIFDNLPIIGVHLVYFPTWIDIWKENKNNLLDDFGTLSPYGISSRNELIDIYKKEFQKSKDIGAKYMVFHLSHVRPRDIFTFSFNYTDEEILTLSLDLINEVFKGDGPMLLFENLPWPGFKITDSNIFENQNIILNFFNKVQYKNKGFILDLSHIVCLNKNLTSYDEAGIFIINLLNKYPLLIKHIKGIHLNCSLSHTYLNQDFIHLINSWETAVPSDKYHLEINHIKSIDTHSTFNSNYILDILKSLPIEFLVYELSHNSLSDLLDKVTEQNNFLTNNNSKI